MQIRHCTDLFFLGFQLKTKIESPSAPFYYFQLHEEGQSPYLYKFEDDQWLWFESNSYVKMELGKQTETLRITKSNYKCDEANANRFMQCMESYFSKQLGCILPWTLKNNNNQDNHGLNECKGKDKFKEFRKITSIILKTRDKKELVKEGCSLPRLAQPHFWCTVPTEYRFLSKYV